MTVAEAQRRARARRAARSYVRALVRWYETGADPPPPDPTGTTWCAAKRIVRSCVRRGRLGFRR